MNKTKEKVIVKKDFCKGCGLCIKFCPDKALAFSKEFNKDGFHPVEWNGDCKLCKICYVVCPHSAIEVE